MAEERYVWIGSPSQILNLDVFFLCTIFSWLIIPIFIGLWKWLEIENTKYELTTERLTIRTGILNKKVDNLELYRIKDYVIVRPWFFIPFSFGNVELTTSDISRPIIKIEAIPEYEKLKERIRNCVETCRTEKGVREFDLNG